MSAILISTDLTSFCRCERSLFQRIVGTHFCLCAPACFVRQGEIQRNLVLYLSPRLLWHQSAAMMRLCSMLRAWSSRIAEHCVDWRPRFGDGCQRSRTNFLHGWNRWDARTENVREHTRIGNKNLDLKHSRSFAAIVCCGTLYHLKRPCR